MNPALISAGISAGTSLLGGLFGSRQASRNATRQHDRNVEYMSRAQGNQIELAEQQNQQTRAVNDRIGEHNANVLANFSTESRSEDTRVTQASAGAIDFGRLVRDSEAAGFNPLTVLRAGGLAGYSVSNTVTDTAFRSTFTPVRELMTYIAPGQIPQAGGTPSAPVQENINYVGDALNAGLAAYNAYDPNAAERAQLEMGIARAQIANYASDTARNRHAMRVPTWTAPGTVRTRGGVGGYAQGGGGSGAMPAGIGVYKPEQGPATITNPWKDGSVASAWPDAEVIETRNGEIPAAIYSVIQPFVDIGENISPGFAGRVTKGAGRVQNATSYAVNKLREQYNNLTASWGRSNTSGVASAPAP